MPWRPTRSKRSVLGRKVILDVNNACSDEDDTTNEAISTQANPHFDSVGHSLGDVVLAQRYKSKGADSGEHLVIKLEKENQRLHNVIEKLNLRIGDETLFEDNTDESDDDSEFRYTTRVNTRHYQLDSSFGKTFYFITNVSIKLKNIN